MSLTRGYQHYFILGQSNLYRLCGFEQFLSTNVETDSGIFLFQKSFQRLDVKLKVFKKGDNKVFRLVQNFTMGEADFNQFVRLRNQLAIAARNFARKDNLSQC